MYDTNDNLVSVELTESTRRALTGEANGAAAIEGRRLEFEACTACEEAWDALCIAVPSVCDLVDYGSPMNAAAAASASSTCETFGGACSKYDASEACQDQCKVERRSIPEVPSTPGMCCNNRWLVVVDFDRRLPLAYLNLAARLQRVVVGWSGFCEGHD